MTKEPRPWQMKHWVGLPRQDTCSAFACAQTVLKEGEVVLPCSLLPCSYQWNHLKPVLIFKLKKNLKLAFSDLGPSESENVDQCDELLERLAGFSK